MIQIEQPRSRKGKLAGIAGRGAVVLQLGLSLASCDALDRALNVEPPSQVPAGLLEAPENANLLVTGTIADFDCALNAYIVGAGLIGNELRDATFTAVRWDYDRRDLTAATATYARNSCTANPPGLYTPISTARLSADNALQVLDRPTHAQVPNREQLVATVAAYSGYSHILLGEGFCPAAIDLGPELTKAQIFGLAEQRFTRAIQTAEAVKSAGGTAAQIAAADTILNMARVGRARARINLGKKAEAAADARLVPTNFVKNANAAATPARRANRMSIQFRLRLVTVEPAYHNLAVGGVADPRVNVVNTNQIGSDAATPIWRAMKYAADDAPIPIATGKEAQLILAEAVGGQQAVNIINTLRARHRLPAFSSTNESEIMAQIVEERRRELFLEGHHLYDLQRFNLPLLPAPGTTYPKGGVYGDLRCLPLPDAERLNNPNIPNTP